MKIFSSKMVVSFLILFSAYSLQAKEFALPEFTQSSSSEWLNSKPLTKNDLIGKVTLIDFWTFDCWNCYLSFPWLHSVEKKLKSQGFQVIGVHSPEYDYEKIHSNIISKIKEFKISNPVMVDNDMAFWNAMNNRYWPSYYLVDKKGVVRDSFVGETHTGSDQANNIEALIQKLLAE